MIVSTKGYAELKELGGFPMEPRVSLLFGTSVYLKRKIDPALFGQFNRDIWFEVRVVNGVHKEATGFLPSANLELSDTPDKVVLLTHDIAPNLGEVRYGMYGTTVWEATCPLCGESPALHVIPETRSKGHTAGTVEDVNRLADAIDDAQAILGAAYKSFFIKPDSREVMIGVLQVEGWHKTYASHSNQQNSAQFAAIANHLGFEYAPPVDKTNMLNRQFKKLSATFKVGRAKEPKEGEQAKEQPTLTTFDYQCAAPRLIQAALHDGEYPVAMSEIYYIARNRRQPDDAKHKHSIPSCSRCRITVPYMLCPE